MANRYTVHSFHPTAFPTKVKLTDGREITAAVPGVVVELLPEDPMQATITWREVTETEAVAKAVANKYAVGGVVSFDGWAAEAPK